jgi:O-antigen ligase
MALGLAPGMRLALLSSERSRRTALTAFALTGAAFCFWYVTTAPSEPLGPIRLTGAGANHTGLYTMATMLAAATAGPLWLWPLAFLPALVPWWRTSSRASPVGTVAGLVTLSLVRPGARVIALFVLAGLNTVLLFADKPLQQATDVLQFGDAQRGLGSGFSGQTDRFADGIGRFAERPLLGHGLHPNNYHNAYIEILAQHGLVGGVLFLLLLHRALTGLWRERRAHMASALLAYAVGYLVRVMFEGTLLRPSNAAGILFPMSLAHGWRLATRPSPLASIPPRHRDGQ